MSLPADSAETVRSSSKFQQKALLACILLLCLVLCCCVSRPSRASCPVLQAYAWVSIIFVFISIFSFCADTHPLFRIRPADVGHFASLYRFFNLESIDLPPRHPLNTSSSSSSSSSSPVFLPPVNRSVLTSNGSLPLPGNQSAEAWEEVEEGDEEELLPHPSLLILDLCCLFFFTLEYMTRLACSPSKVHFLRSFQNVIDFIAISPDYVELLLLAFDPVKREGMAVMDLMFILRMLRLCRIFRLIRHVPGLWILLYTLKASFNELMLMFVFLLIGMVVFATLMHFAEARHGFPNIPVGFWWSVVTMTTVGYGDMVPNTPAGYVIGSCCAVAGLLMIAFTVPIIVSNFVLYYTHVQYGLARRDRELERMDEEGQGQGQGQGQGDEENPSGSVREEVCAGGGGGLPGDWDRGGRAGQVAVLHVGAGNGGAVGGGGRGGGGGGPAKAEVDSVAIALGQHVALTSPAALTEDRLALEEEGERTADRVILV